MRKTKIVCTLGPASDSEEIIKQLILSGMDAARLNEWTQEDIWRPHTSLLFNPQAAFDTIAKAMREKFEPFTAQVNQMEFSRVYEGGYTIIDAMSCADMALAGLDGDIPCDEVIDAMGAVGRALPSSLRETGEGGLAATPTGRKIAEGR